MRLQKPAVLALVVSMASLPLCPSNMMIVSNVWLKRSGLSGNDWSASGLIGAGIDAETGAWVDPADCGAGIAAVSSNMPSKPHVLLSALEGDSACH